MFYSKTTGGFYDPVIHGESIPADAVVISKEVYEALIAEQASGKAIVGDANGKPVAVVAEKTWDSIRAKRNSLLLASDWTQLSDSPADKAAWSAYRQELRDVTSTYATPDEVVWPTPPQ